jgi:hypothetical protein
MALARRENLRRARAGKQSSLAAGVYPGLIAMRSLLANSSNGFDKHLSVIVTHRERRCYPYKARSV